jgi:hypothetical protein
MPILPGGLVWLASYPKSGNTFEEETLVDSHLLLPREIEGCGPPSTLRVPLQGALPSQGSRCVDSAARWHAAAGPGRMGGAYFVREPRDIAVFLRSTWPSAWMRRLNT